MGSSRTSLSRGSAQPAFQGLYAVATFGPFHGRTSWRTNLSLHLHCVLSAQKELSLQTEDRRSLTRTEACGPLLSTTTVSPTSPQSPSWVQPPGLTSPSSTSVQLFIFVYLLTMKVHYFYIRSNCSKYHLPLRRNACKGPTPPIGNISIIISMVMKAMNFVVK